MGTGLEMVRAGALDLVVDRGRFGLRDRGVGPGGPADKWSFALTNALAGNPLEENAAGLEFAMVGPRLKALGQMGLALGGGATQACVVQPDGKTRAVAPWSSLTLNLGDHLIIGPVEKGVRGYMAVRGGVRDRLVAGSRQSGSPLKAGDLLAAENGQLPWRHCAPEWAERALGPGDGVLRILPGPHWGRLGWSGPESADMVVGERTDRMGIRLGLVEPGKEPPGGLLSEPVCPGVVQAPSKNEWIILGVGCQTLGGYAKVGQLIEADLDLAGQLRPGDRTRMRVVTPVEATEANREYRRELARRCQVAFLCLGQIFVEGN